MYKDNNEVLVEMCIERGIISNNENFLAIGSKLYSNKNKILEILEKDSEVKAYLVDKLDIDQAKIRSLNNQVLFLEEQLDTQQKMLEL